MIKKNIYINDYNKVYADIILIISMMVRIIIC